MLSSWFRRSTPQDAQTGIVPEDRDTVVDARDIDDFTAIDLRPPTYAEASEQRFPAANRREKGTMPYSSIDDAQMAVRLVDEYIRDCERDAKRGPSSHVLANIEWGDASTELKWKSAKGRRQRRSSKRATKDRPLHRQPH